MKEARSLPTRRGRSPRTAALLGLVLSTWGCQQPPCYDYYGYGAPPCSPVVPAPSAAQKGSVCDVPTQVIEGGTTLADGPSRSSSVNGVNSSRVVVSQPSDSNPPRLTWRRTEPDGRVTTTTVDGAADDATVNR